MASLPDLRGARFDAWLSASLYMSTRKVGDMSTRKERAQGVDMDIPEIPQREVNRLGAAAGSVFLTVEVVAYVVLGIMLAVAVLIGVGGAAVSLWGAIEANGEAQALVVAVDRLLFVLMVVEVMHTVRVSFRSGRLVCEPFLIVGLIASIRRVLVITLETSQAHQPGKWSPDAQALLNSTMLELSVLGGLILVMVISIFMLRISDRALAADDRHTH
jgi:uncharacterized membrane protein (DUF373 family)